MSQPYVSYDPSQPVTVVIETDPLKERYKVSNGHVRFYLPYPDSTVLVKTTGFSSDSNRWATLLAEWSSLQRGQLLFNELESFSTSKPSVNAQSCTCASRDLFHYGCRCGYKGV